MSELLTGLICLWHGAIVDIPAGWHLCDGTVGTPDLRDRFIVGAGSAYAVGASGGSSTHSHTFTTAGHFHTMQALMGVAAGVNYSSQTSSNTDNGITNSVNHRPPYYALAYIMKL
jgi:hypothetical protein